MRTADMPTGTLLGGRYLLTRPLGAGSSATVYLAEDRSLRREVAVKVLRAALMSDGRFLKRFRAEAVAVAGLNHPHVLRVFDWGEADDGAWLVTEYLEGGSLRDLLDRRGVLPLEQVASIGAQAADGLNYAHTRGFVHRDVKPTNLLFDDAGRVRITDFGVARALAEATWTEPTEGLIGTVRYSSPEQAMGHRVDPKTDVYSLALVLYECVTGDVPFSSDSQVATLQARIGAPLPGHYALGPLGDVLAAAAAPDPADRLDAGELWVRLTEVARSLPDPGPVRGPRHSAATGFTPPSIHELTGPPRTEAPSLTRPMAATTIPHGPEAATEAPVRVADAPGRDTTVVGSLGEPPRSRRRRRWPIVLALVVALGLVAAGIVDVTRAKPTPTFKLPDVVGLATNVMESKLGSHHLRIEQTLRTSKTVQAGYILGQSPRPGTRLKDGSVLKVVSSAGPPPIAVPTVVGEPDSAATTKLEGAGFKVTSPTTLAAYSTSIPAGDTIAVYAGNAEDPPNAAYGSTLAIQLSKGRPPVAIPLVVGQPGLDAVAALQRAGFVPVVHRAFSPTVHAGNVISTDPRPKALLQPGRSVVVVVSEGPAIAVPALGHLTLSQAEKAIVDAGLTVLAVHGSTSSEEWTSKPGAGTLVAKGTSISLYAG